MGRSPRIDVPGAIFHITARGNARRQIFYGQNDWEFFLNTLAKLKKDRPFGCLAYCLMSNHVHLLLQRALFSISDLMRLLLGRYAQHLNRAQGTTGHVFQERFHSVLCQRDAYLQQVVRYIHHNPVAAGIVDEPGAWPYSSHNEYLGQGTRTLVDADPLLSTFHDDAAVAREMYRDFMSRGKSSEFQLPQETTLGLPSSATISYPSPRPGIEESFSALRIEHILDSTAAQANLPPEVLRGGSRVPRVVQARRDFIAEAFQKGHSPTAIARHLSLTVSSVTRALGKVE